MMPSNHSIASDAKGKIHIALKQIQKSSKAIDKILLEYKIEDLHEANQRYIQLKKRIGQADNNEEFESMKQMYNTYKKLKYHQKKKQTAQTLFDPMVNTLEQIQKTSKVIDKILQENTIEDLHVANYRYIQMNRRKGQSDSNEEFESVKQMHNNYKKLIYHQKKKDTSQTLLEQSDAHSIDLIEGITEDDSSTDSSQQNFMCVNCNRHQIQESTCDNIQDDNDFISFMQV